jgi:hypothetical protein
MMHKLTVSMALLLTLVALPGAGAAQGPDELWEISAKMEMAGLPMAMPSQTNQVCRPAGKTQDEEMVPKNQDCRMTDMRRSGSRTTFTMVCEGKDKLTGTGDIVTDPSGYRGTMRLRGTMDGQPVDMTQNFSGRRIGTCTYEDPKKKQDALMAQQCVQALDRMNSYAFTMEQSPCKAQKPEFCARVAKLAQEMQEPPTYRATLQKRSDWPQMMQACGQDTTPVTGAACQRAIGGKDYTFLGDFCEPDARALAAQHCTGRDYTALMSSEYAPLCRRFAAGTRPAAPAARPAATPAPPAQPTSPSPQAEVTDAAKDGVKQGLKEGLREGAVEGIRRLFRW